MGGGGGGFSQQAASYLRTQWHIQTPKTCRGTQKHGPIQTEPVEKANTKPQTGVSLSKGLAV